jgi:ribosomal protein S18
LIESNKREKKLQRAKALKKMFLKKYPDLYTEKDEQFLDKYVTEKFKIESEKTIAQVMRRPGPDGLFKDQP